MGLLWCLSGPGRRLTPHEAAAVAQVLLPMLTHLLKDDQESVRKLALDSMAAFAKALASTEVAGDVLDAASAIIGDRSWRVRHAAASKTPALAEAFGPTITESHLVKSFVSLLQVRSPPRCRAALYSGISSMHEQRSSRIAVNGPARSALCAQREQAWWCVP